MMSGKSRRTRLEDWRHVHVSLMDDPEDSSVCLHAANCTVDYGDQFLYTSHPFTKPYQIEPISRVRVSWKW